MTLESRKKIIDLIEKKINYEYPLRWADEKTTLGDFDGREFTIDVFRIPISKQIDFLSAIRPIRNEITSIAGNRCLFIFHTPIATDKYYFHLFPITKGILLENNRTMKLPLPNIGGTEGSPIISDTTTGIYIKYGAAA